MSSRAGKLAILWGARLHGMAVAGTTTSELRAACAEMLHDIDGVEAVESSDAMRDRERARIHEEQLRLIAEHKRHEELVAVMRDVLCPVRP